MTWVAEKINKHLEQVNADGLAKKCPLCGKPAVSCTINESKGIYEIKHTTMVMSHHRRSGRVRQTTYCRMPLKAVG
jgi:hypothetical protein